MEEAPLASKPEAEPGAETEVDSLDSVDPDLDAVDAVDYAPLNGSDLDLYL
jgi:hypothetical protein